MKIEEFHPWPSYCEEAEQIQKKYCKQVVLTPLSRQISLVAGVDTAFDPVLNRLFSAVCVFTYPELILSEQVIASAPAQFPYIPGLHIFREGPVLIKALKRLTISPDVIIFSGHGIAHARKFGLASHMGILIDCPTIGCARKRLAGQYQKVGPNKGDSSELVLHNSPVGLVYRSRENVKPIFISPGHRCVIKDATRIVIGCLGKYRLPEPLRAAHRLANRTKRQFQTEAS